MERLIPRDSKLKARFFKSFTLIDLIILTVMLGVGILIMLSDIANRWIIFGVYFLVCVILFIGEGEDRTYNQIAVLSRYLISRKSYEKGTKHGTEELMPFRSIRDDGIVEYDGYYGAVIEIGSLDFGLLDEDEQNRRIYQFANVLNAISQTEVVQLIKLDRPINYDEISANLFAKLEDAKERGDEIQCAILKSRLEQVDTVNNIVPLYRPCYYLAVFDNDVDALYNQIDMCFGGFDNIGLDANFLGAEEVAAYYKYNYSQDFDEREVEGLTNDELADYVRPDKIKFSFAGYTVNDVSAVTFAVNEYPLYVGNAWGAEIFSIDNTKIVLTIKPVDKVKAIKRIDKSALESITKNTAKLSEMRDQETHLQTLGELQARIQNENEMLYDCTLTVTGFNNTQENNNAFRKKLRREFTTRGFRLNYLLGRQIDGFAKSTVARRPKLHGFERGINSDSLAAVFPFVFSNITDVDGFYLGADFYPVILDIWKRSGEYVNSNGVILGKSGGGKSYFCKILLTLLYSENTCIFVLDPEDEYNVLAKNLGGLFIDVGSATQGRINPLHVYPVLTDEGELAAPDVTFNAHLQFLEDFFKLTLKGITQDAFEELNNIVKLTYENVGINRDVDCSDLRPDDFPTFDVLLGTVETEMKREDLSPFRRRNLETVSMYVKKFASGGMYSSLWNGPSTLVVDSRFVVFNFQSLFGAKNKTVSNAQILVVMRYLDMQIINIREENRNSSGEIVHPFILLDEGYNFIDKDYPVALQFVYQWYKRIRKYEGSMFFATQDLNDIFGKSEIISQTTAIVNNSQYSFIFGLAPANLEILADLYRNSGGLNDAERSYITNADRGDCFALCSPRRRARFHVEASDTVRALFDEKSVQR